MSRDLLNGFKSLNMNKLKADEEADSNAEEETEVLNATAEAKKKEEGAFQNFIPLEPDKSMKRIKLFQDVFLIYRQALRDDEGGAWFLIKKMKLQKY